jgi:hypothetical protein
VDYAEITVTVTFSVRPSEKAKAIDEILYACDTACSNLPYVTEVWTEVADLEEEVGVETVDE